MRRPADLGDRAPLVKAKAMETHHGSASPPPKKAWRARIRSCLWSRRKAHRRATLAAKILDQTQREDRHHLGDSFVGPRRDPWERLYADAYGIDTESGYPLEHASLVRLGASWRFMWACRQTIIKIPNRVGAVVEGECALADGSFVRGAFYVASVPLLSEVAFEDRHEPEDDLAIHGETDDVTHDIVKSARETAISGCFDQAKEKVMHVDAAVDKSLQIACQRISCLIDNVASITAIGSNAEPADHERGLALLPHGYAATVRPDGSLAEGVFFQGLLDGQGRVVDSRGEIFGGWRRGRLHGRAVATTPDGWFVCAVWEDGRLVGDYFAHSSHGEQFRCASCIDGRFDGRCRRGYPNGDWATEMWSDGVLVGIERYRIAPVPQSTALSRGATLDGCLWTCRFTDGDNDGSQPGALVYHPADPACSEFDLFYAYIVSEASTKAFTHEQREAIAWAMWSARMRPTDPDAMPMANDAQEAIFGLDREQDPHGQRETDRESVMTQ
jgi:hypothetical protein